MLLDPSGKMRKASYIDASTMYEVPMNCLQRFRGIMKIQRCSLALAAGAAAEAIADLLSSTNIYTTNTKDRLARKLYDAGTQVVSEGRFCWVQPANGHLTDTSGHHHVRNAAGPCIVVRIDGQTARIRIL